MAKLLGVAQAMVANSTATAAIVRAFEYRWVFRAG
jgi:hypothetical protein